jgi:hypothetical protein
MAHPDENSGPIGPCFSNKDSEASNAQSTSCQPMLPVGIDPNRESQRGPKSALLRDVSGEQDARPIRSVHDGADGEATRLKAATKADTSPANVCTSHARTESSRELAVRSQQPELVVVDVSLQHGDLPQVAPTDQSVFADPLSIGVVGIGAGRLIGQLTSMRQN